MTPIASLKFASSNSSGLGKEEEVNEPELSQ
jgi:hypothetical protein